MTTKIFCLTIMRKTLPAFHAAIIDSTHVNLKSSERKFHDKLSGILFNECSIDSLQESQAPHFDCFPSRGILSVWNVISSISAKRKFCLLKCRAEEHSQISFQEYSNIFPQNLSITKLANFLRLWLCKVIKTKVLSSWRAQGIKQYFQIAC